MKCWRLLSVVRNAMVDVWLSYSLFCSLHLRRMERSSEHIFVYAPLFNPDRGITCPLRQQHGLQKDMKQKGVPCCTEYIGRFGVIGVWNQRSQTA